jgi:glycosyltransferase involved in cell wall biosynthesis
MPSVKTWRAKLFRHIVFAFKIFISAVQYRPTLIVCGHVGFSSVCLVISKIIGVPYVTLAHGVEVWGMGRAKRISLAFSKKILAVSRYTRQRILDQIPGCTASRVSVFPNTFDSDRFCPSPKSRDLMRRLGLVDTDLIVLSVSRLSSSEGAKGCDKVISGIKGLSTRFPNLKYIACGSGDDLPRLRAVARDAGLLDKVIFPGFIPDALLPDYYNLCDLFVLPSKKEGFGIVFLEALGCGKPVVAGNKDGSVDALLDGELGLLIDPDSADAVTEAILKVLNKNVPIRTLDGSYLRSHVIRVYGFAAFKSRLGELLLCD